jgi:pimeloyl-ACP methyl ester carboxylesterase
MESGYVDANRQQLYYEIHGEGDPLLLIMGLGGDLTGWGLQVPAFQEHFKVIVFDNRDAGRSSQVDNPYAISDMARDTAGLLDGLGVDQAHVLGASMGGMIAQELALSRPEKVGKLVLSCSMAQVARFHVSFAQPWKWIMDHDPKGEILPVHIITLCMTHNFQQNADAVEEMIEQMLNAPYPQPPEAFGRQADALSAFDALNQLEGISAPTLVMVADQDVLTPPWAARQLAEAIPGAELQVLEGGGHCMFWEIPDEFNEAVLAFLAA